MTIYSCYADGTLFYRSDVNEDAYQILSPTLDEDLEKIAAFSFTILPTNHMYNQFNLMKTIIEFKNNDRVIFRGRVIKCESDVYGQMQVECEGEKAYLMDSVLQPYSYETTVKGAFTRIINGHNAQVEAAKRFTLGNVTCDKAEFQSSFSSTSFQESSSAMDNLTDKFGGYILVRRVGNVNYLDYVQDYPATCNQAIEIGVNLVDFTSATSSEDLFTVLIPLGKNNTTIANVNNGSIYLENAEFVAKYGRIVRVKQWSDVTAASQIKSKGQEYLNKMCGYSLNDYTMSAIDMHILDDSVDEIILGAKVRIRIPSRDINVTKTVLAINHDFQNPNSTSYTIGDISQTEEATRSTTAMTIGQLMAAADIDGRIHRGNLGFDIEEQFSVNARNIKFIASCNTDKFSEKTAYKKDDYVVYGAANTLYRCIKATGPGAFNEECWAASTVDEGLIQFNSRQLQMVNDLTELTTNVLDIYTTGDGEIVSRKLVSIHDDIVEVNGKLTAEYISGTLLKGATMDVALLTCTNLVSRALISGKTVVGTTVYSGGTEDTNKVATQGWVENQGYKRTWYEMTGHATLNTYTITDLTGVTYTVYGE